MTEPILIDNGCWYAPQGVVDKYGVEFLDALNKRGSLVKRGIPLTENKYATGGRVEQKPTVGRVVHYRSYGTPGGEYLPEARAAIVTQVGFEDGDYYASLCVLNPTGMFFNEKVAYSADDAPGCWSWPPRV